MKWDSVDEKTFYKVIGELDVGTDKIRFFDKGVDWKAIHTLKLRYKYKPIAKTISNGVNETGTKYYLSEGYKSGIIS